MTTASPWFAPLYVLLLWWLGTGAVLWLQDRVRPGSRRLGVGIALFALACAVALVIFSRDVGARGSIGGFTAAIGLWGALELCLNLGLVTGTHRVACPAHSTGWARFRLALGTTIWHELSVLVTGLAIALLLLEAANPAGALGFTVLWLMRWSAKLNLFFGVPNFSTEWFPERLAHIASYVNRGPVTAFYPIALTAACVVCVLMIERAVEAPGSASLVYALPATLLALAVLEHLFLALPLSDLELWNRLFRSREAPATTPVAAPVTATVGHGRDPESPR